MNKKKILISLGVIAIVAAIAIGGTIAYFSDTEKSHITFTSGTVNLQLSKDNGASWHNGLSFNLPNNWAPGDTYSIQVWTRNMGNAGLFNLFVTGDKLAGPNLNLADRIYITDVAYTDTIGWVHPGGGTYYADNNIFGGSDGKLSLRELANGLTNGKKMNFCWGGPEDKIDYLPANGSRIQKFYIEFTFDPEAGNEWQGKSVSFDLLFRGTDEPGTYVWWPGI